MQELRRQRFQTRACIAGGRTFLMVFNVIFWIFGLLFLIFGLWMRVSIAKMFEITPHFSFPLPTLLIVTGSVMMVIGVLACLCSSTDSTVLLYVLSGIFFLVFALILASSIAGYVYRDNLKKEFLKSLNQSISEYGNGSAVLDKDLDRLQQHFQCCGVNNYTDFTVSPWHTQSGNLTFPDSCCRTLKQCDNINTEQIYQEGCFNKIIVMLNENLSSLGLATLFISLFQLCGVTLSICLANHINRANYEEMY